MSAVMPEQADQEREAGWVNGNTPGSCISQSRELQKEMAGLTGWSSPEKAVANSLVLQHQGEHSGEELGLKAS